MTILILWKRNYIIRKGSFFFIYLVFSFWRCLEDKARREKKTGEEEKENASIRTRMLLVDRNLSNEVESDKDQKEYVYIQPSKSPELGNPQPSDKDWRNSFQCTTQDSDTIASSQLDGGLNENFRPETNGGMNFSMEKKSPYFSVGWEGEAE